MQAKAADDLWLHTATSSLWVVILVDAFSLQIDVPLLAAPRCYGRIADSLAYGGLDVAVVK